MYTCVCVCSAMKVRHIPNIVARAVDSVHTACAECAEWIVKHGETEKTEKTDFSSRTESDWFFYTFQRTNRAHCIGLQESHCGSKY